MLFLLDNYDSFTYNLVQYFQMLGAEVCVMTPDEPVFETLSEVNPRAIVISPGPGKPDDALVAKKLIQQYLGRLPILGVCLGHQCLVQVLGGTILRAERIMHGKVDKITHVEKDLFRDCPSPLNVTRYHSLIAEPIDLPSCLKVQARTALGEIMAVRHESALAFGLQFHPESICTEYGLKMCENFLALLSRLTRLY